MIVAAAGVVVAIGMLAYHYRSDSPADGPRPAAKGEASERGATPNTGVIGRTPPAEAPKAPLAPPTVAVEPPKAPVASPGQAPLQPPKPQVESAKAPAPPAPLRSEKSAVITRLPEAAPGTPLRAPERPSRTQPCTEATAALGLCVLKPAPKGKPPASVQSAATREQAIDAGRTVGQQPAPSQTCTEAVAALGLCTPKPTPRKE